MEARSRTKWETDGWEFVEQADATMFRSSLLFRRPKKQLPRWVVFAGATVAALAVIAIVIGAVTETNSKPVPPAASQGAAPSPSPTGDDESIRPSAEPSDEPQVTDEEVLDAFKSFFDERASSGVVLAKSVSSITFLDGVLRVTFDPATAGIGQDLFDTANVFPNLANFVATPIAFNDEIGNRIRPVVDSIETVHADGSPLGTFSRADILSLNELDE